MLMQTIAITTIYTTVDDILKSNELIRELLDLKLIACANTFPIGSSYYWGESICESNETGILLKTSQNKENSLLEFLRNNHPYQIPLLLIQHPLVNESYFQWMEETLKD